LGVNLIVNPIAGNKAYRSIERIKDLLSRHASINTFITQKRGDAFSFARDHADAELIIVAGGDGTFNEVINGLLSSKDESPVKDRCRLAFIPLGTTNVLAKELGIPEDIDKAIDLALTGSPRKISLGRINGHYFALMAGIGFDGEAVFRVKESVKKISGKGAYILSGIKTFIKYNPPLIKIKTPEGTLEGYTAIVGKSRCYGGRFKVTPLADITKPSLDLCLLRNNSRLALIRFIYGVLIKRHLNFKDIFYKKFSELEISSKETVYVQIDGDYFGTLPVKIDVVKDAINLIW
jgi:YegS/Rv2252/BmrU family lipid kinase